MNRRQWILFACAGLGACSKPATEKPVSQDGAGAAPVATPESKAPAAADSRPVIVAFGDSLTAGYGLDPGQGYPEWLQKRLDKEDYPYRVVNQGISGDTTSGGVSRMGDAIALKPAIVILELGANDGLRGLPADATKANLAQMIDSFQQAGAKVVLAGMTLPRNYGPDYIKAFEQVFGSLTKEKKVTLIPFLLEGVATKRDLMQQDALHPTAEGCRLVAETVFRAIKPLLEKKG